jgi:hypothetical protein
VFLSELGGDPHDVGWVRAARVGEQLAEVDVVSAIELVLDDHPLVGGLVDPDQVEQEPTH